MLLHYEDPLLSNLYFMDPQWLCDMLARIVTVRDSINPLVSDGRLLIHWLLWHLATFIMLYRCDAYL